MTNPITSTLKYAEFGSNDRLANALIRARQDLAWIKPRSLGAKIGELDRGIVTWWLTRTAQTEALAALLEVPVEDLGVMQRTLSCVVSFPDFPALKPLDLRREKPWKLAQELQVEVGNAKSEYGRPTLEDWFEPTPTARPPHDFSWLQVDSEMERQLLTQRLVAAGRFEVVAAETLADAAEKLRGHKPLVVSLEQSGGDADLYALADRPEFAGLFVIAPFQLPVRVETFAAGFCDWERLVSHGLERLKFDLTDAVLGFKRWIWTLQPDWRRELLNWVEARLKLAGTDTLFTAQGVGDWLDRFDPQEAWFSKPADVLQLCQMAHTVPDRKLPAANDLHAGQKLAKLLFKNGPVYRHAQLEQLAHQRWSQNELTWLGVLPMDSWLLLAPVAAVSPDALKHAANGTNLATVKAALLQLARQAELGSPDALVQSELIQVNRQGGYDFKQKTLAALLVRDMLLHQVANESASTWAWACFDPERRQVVDAVLDAASLPQLLVVTQRLEADAITQAERVGASEALFMAVGRRILRGEAIDADFLQLARMVVSQLDMPSVEWMLPVPLSSPTQTNDEQLSWIAVCWAWSLLPNADPPPDSWLFPGWCQSQNMPEVPWWVDGLWPSEKYEAASPAWLQFLGVIDAWLKDVEEPALDAPRCLHVGLLARAAAGQWAPNPDWWAEVISTRWAQDAVTERLNALDKRDETTIAMRLWPSWLAFEKAYPANTLFGVTFAMPRRWLLESMNPADAMEALTEEDLQYLVQRPTELPPAFRLLLLKKIMPLLLDKPSMNAFTLQAGSVTRFFERFGASVAPLMHDFLACSWLGSPAAECLWEWDPVAATQLLKQPEQLAAAARQNLVAVCPPSHLNLAASVMRTSPELFDLPSLEYWASRQLPNAGRNADMLLTIIEAARLARKATLLAEENVDDSA